MRLTVEEVKTREAFLTELFKGNPSLSIRGAQLAIVAKFTRSMRPHRILQIRNLVTAGQKVLPPETEAHSEPQTEAAPGQTDQSPSVS